MRLLPNVRLLVVWGLLSGVTLLAWWMGETRSQGDPQPESAIAIGAIAITVVKVRLVVFEFMDGRHGPPVLRWLTNAWLTIFSGAMLAAYFLAG